MGSTMVLFLALTAAVTIMNAVVLLLVWRAYRRMVERCSTVMTRATGPEMRNAIADLDAGAARAAALTADCVESMRQLDAGLESAAGRQRRFVARFEIESDRWAERLRTPPAAVIAGWLGASGRLRWFFDGMRLAAGVVERIRTR